MLKRFLSILWLFTVILLSAPVITSCGGDDGDEPETPVTPTDPTDPTEPTTPTSTACQGWPEAYDGVMLQGFYWDSYGDSQWYQLTEQADELSQYFSLIWVPNSGSTSTYSITGGQTMGYDPCFWLNHNSCWGSENLLKTMISTFKKKGTGIIEDVVINHKNGLTSWCDFPDETKGSYVIKWDNTNFSGICKDDECNQNGYKTTGAKDTGDNFDGYRDLDHTNAQVQQNVKTYLAYLLKELGYVGFRYDMVKGYAAKYTAMYNESAQPQFSVGEYWDGNKTAVVNWLNGTKKDGKIQSAAFDFPLKYRINSAFSDEAWLNLTQSSLANDRTYQRYAVTFIDNHDTYRDDNRLKKNVCAANAYILCMPGTPCLFLKHWQKYRGTLKKLIALRKAAGINNQSSILVSSKQGLGYLLIMQGTKGKLRLILGDIDDDIFNNQNYNNPDDKWQMAVSGKNFTVYANKDVDLTAVKAITDKDEEAEETGAFTIPDFCTIDPVATVYAFFESPSSWNTVTCWAWNSEENFANGPWPGTKCKEIGMRGNKKVWRWSYYLLTSKLPTGIIFSNNGEDQTADLPFKNGGYYNENGELLGIVSGK